MGQVKFRDDARSGQSSTVTCVQVKDQIDQRKK
jgi:hypothetical protein